MSLNRSFTRTHKFVFILILTVTSAAAGFGLYGTDAVKRVFTGGQAAAASTSFKTVESVAPTVSVETPRSPWIKMREGKPLATEYTGTETAIARFQSGDLRSTTMATADVNADGYPDLISGFSSPDGGVVTVHTGARQAFGPDDADVLAGIRNGEFPASFDKEARSIDVASSPDFLFTGRFLYGSNLDLAVATRGSSVITIYSFDDKGALGSPVQVDLGGAVTAIAADTLDATKGFTGIVAATDSDNVSSLVVIDGQHAIDASKPTRIGLDRPIDSLVIRTPDGLTTDKDVFMLGAGRLSRVERIGRGDAAASSIDLPFGVQDFAAGEFIRDRRAKTEIAVLADNGSIYYLANGDLDKRPFTEAEMRANFAKYGRGRSTVADTTDRSSALANNWAVAEQQDLGLVNPLRTNGQPLLRRAYITGNETDDLMVVDGSANKIRVLFKEPVTGTNRAAFTGDTQVEDMSFAGGISAALPIRLNVMGQQGIAVMQAGRLVPTPVMFAPSATFTVSKTADTNDGVCAADCSLREAVVAANAAAGADLITFAPNGTHQLTIGGANESSAATGDLDITQSTTITGNGEANTTLAGGASAATGIDKVLSINPTFSSAFATSISGVTVKFGKNPSGFSGDGFGGGFDWEGSGTGTLSVTNSTISNNLTTDGDGGGIVATNSSAGAGAVTISGSTVANNTPARIGANSPLGGGVFVGSSTPYFVTNTAFTGNSVSGSGGQGQGGGIYGFGPGGSGGTSFVTGGTITSNTAPSDGGGILSTQRVDISSGTAINGNSSGRFGGGVFINHNAATSTFTKITITGNSATTTGSGIYLGTTTTANVLNMSFSRIANNAGAGLKGFATAGGTSTAENNWWGCNTTSTAGPCDTTGNTGAGTVDANPWLKMTTTASPTSVLVGNTSSLTTSFLLNSDNAAVSTANLTTIIGQTVGWSAVGGTISGAQTSIQAAGTATATYNATVAGAGSATATVDNGPSTVSITVTAPPSADLAITKTDGVTTVTAGGSTTYTITASNAGPDAATGATVADTLPASLTATWTCVGAGGGTCTASGSGNINNSVNLPAGGSVTFTVSAAISASATGTLSNTATVAVPGGTIDPTPGNNSATDTDTIAQSANLGITKTDGVTTVTAGGATTYTITASNAGPSNAPGSTVADTLPATLTGTWTCVGAGGGTCTSSGSGNINDTVNLPSGGSVTYTVSAVISASATGTLSNTAAVATAGGITDPTPGNNSATDTDTIAQSADLSITKTDGASTEIPGTSITYTITASNTGPSNAASATVADTFPGTITGVTWTCVGAGGGTCAASGSGNINATVNLPAGGSVTFTASGTISAGATGTLSNTATVTSAVTDPNSGNNSATDNDTLVPTADLSITKTDGVTTVTAGGSTTYTITASNAGPSNVTGATVADTFPASLTGTWTCVGAGGGTCTASGSGNINQTVNLPAGGSVTYTVSAAISASATGTLSNTATVAAPGGVTDPTPGNNSATDTDTIAVSANLGITKTDGVTSVTPGGSTTYTIVASNAGPSNAPGSTVADTFPATLTGTWTCVGAGGGTCSASGSGNINDTVNLPSGGSVTYTVSATVSGSATGSISNTATVATAGGVTDPTPGNNSATDTDTVTATADLSITKTDGVTTVTAGGSTTYTITASNAGPSTATGATVADTFPASLTGTWTCVGAGGGTCTASGSGNINQTVNLPSGGSVTFTVSAAISAGATGSLVNTATVTAPGGVTDPTPGNNSATDTDTIGQSADLAITKTDGVTSVTAGTTTTYTIVASNAGPSNAVGATVADTFPVAITGVSWTCVGAGGGTCTASGTGNINDTVNLPAGGSVTYTAVSTIAVSATGTLTNTATVAAPGGVTDPTPGNNSATDTDTIIPSDTTPPTGVGSLTNVLVPGGSLYTFTVTYADASGINVSTLDNNDITITGPSAFTTPATFVSVDVNTNGTPRVATYSFVPPGGTWDPADSGTYNVSMNASQVADTVGNFVNSGSLGTFYAVPPVYVVDRTDDSVAASACTAAANDCSLRGAIAAANLTALPDTINFDPTVFATPQTITLGGTEIVITNAGGLTINGPGPGILTVNANAASRVFTNSANAVTTISGMRLTGGTGTGAAGTGRGGAVYNTGGTLTLNGLVITGNTSANGAALSNATGPATLNVNNCWITANATPGSGGAIQNFSGTTVVTNINNSSITGNTSNSTSVGGGGIQANGVVNITNSTIGGNVATGGSGAIFYNGTGLTVTNSTIAGNTSTNNGGGIHSTSATPAIIRNSIIAGNNGTVASPDMTGIANSLGNNIVGTVGTSTGWVGSDLQNVNPLLAPLGFYGGNGYTFALTSASPAINAGQACVTNQTCATNNPSFALTSDQRGAARIGGVDIGAFELNNSANGGSYVALLPTALQGTAYNFILAPVNGVFSQTVTIGSLPANILLNSGASATFTGTPSASGDYLFSITATGGGNSNLTDYRMVVFAPPGGLVSVSGRVMTVSGSPVNGATVVLTDTLNVSRYAKTTPLGYYTIQNVPAGATYTVSQSSKRYQFTPYSVAVNYNLTNVDLAVTPNP